MCYRRHKTKSKEGKKKKKRGSNDKNVETNSSSDLVNPKEHTAVGIVRGSRSKRSRPLSKARRKESKQTASELYKRMKDKKLITREEVAKMSPGQRQKRLADAQKALGFKPNISIVERLVEREKTQASQSSQIGTSSRKIGDIVFSVPKPKKKTPALDDDTQFPRAVKMKGAVGKVTPAEAASDPDYFKPPLFSSEQETDEILSEDEDGVPDEVNWMYHTKEIQAVQDIIRIADNKVGGIAIGGKADHSREAIVHDPYAPIECLENDEEKKTKLYSCLALRYGTFVTTAQAAPTEEEKAEAANKKFHKPIASIISAGTDISQFPIDYPSDQAFSDSDHDNDQLPIAFPPTKDSSRKKIMPGSSAKTSKKSRKQAKSSVKEDKTAPSKQASREARQSQESPKASRELKASKEFGRTASKDHVGASREVKTQGRTDSKEKNRGSS
ncbi:hypothetical protein Ddc_00061 [Ditylenchus destructor]|nr:hypothetical protein Ddc_00061 [Ditylenchus destructor]